MRSQHLVAALTLVVALVTAPASADEIQLQNGDRITGTIVRLVSGTLTFKTAGGDLNIPWATITSITSTQTLRVTIANRPDPLTITAFATGAPGQIVLTPGGQVAATDVTGMSPIEPPITVTGGASGGFVNSTGNTNVNSLRLDADVEVRQNVHRYRATAAVNRVEDDGVATAKNWNTGLNYDYFLNKRLFLNANVIFTNDPFRDLDLRTALGGGIGYQFVDTPLVKLTVKGGLGWVNEDFIVAVDNDYTAAQESATLDVLAVPDRVLFFHKHNAYFGLTTFDDLFVTTSNGVRLTIVKNFITTLQLDLDYTVTPSPGLKSTDRTFAWTFGYRF